MSEHGTRPEGDDIPEQTGTDEPYDEVGQIMAFEEGQLDDEEVVTLFQHLIDSGLVWQLQGAYGRQAHALIEGGWCHVPKAQLH